MVQVTVTASMKVAGGPTLSLNSGIEPQSYTAASIALGAAGDASATQTIDLLPDGGTVVLLGLSARTAAGKPAEVKLTPSKGAVDGHAFTVDGTLVLANAGVLEALVAGGPRSVTLKNEGPDPVTVDLLTGRDGA